MTMTKHQQTPRKTRGGSADKVWAVGLAGATCLGLVGVVGVRSVEEAAAATPVQDEATLVLTTSASSEAVSTSGLTEEQLDEDARALEVERLRLEAYHAELLDVAAQLQASADSIAQASKAAPVSSSSSAKSTSNAKSTGKANSTGKNSGNDGGGKPAAASQEQANAQPKLAAKPAPVAKPVPQQAPQATTRGS